MKAERALLSVADKAGVVNFARALVDLGMEIVSTGGTRRTLADANVPVVDVAAVTGFPEIMDGRVKTLHPKIHGGILARRKQDDGLLLEHGIHRIDVVAVNLYPFAQTVARADCTLQLAIENVDIGGPALLRAAAKNHRDVLVVCDPADYAAAARGLAEDDVDRCFRLRMATKAFAHTAAYDATIAEYLQQIDASGNG